MNNKVLKRNKKIYNEVPENILVSILTLHYNMKRITFKNIFDFSDRYNF